MTLSLPLIDAFSNHNLGFCGQRDPAKTLESITLLERRLSVLSFGVISSTTPLDLKHWEQLVNSGDHWLFDPAQVAYKSSQEVQNTIRELSISAPQYIGRVWWHVCRGVQGRLKGSWRSLLKSNDDDCRKLLAYFNQSLATFPVLSGPVFCVRWLDLVHRVGGVSLIGWESLAVPLALSQVDVAASFGITAQEVHPLVSAALSTWSTACKTLPPDSCGLLSCPKRA